MHELSICGSIADIVTRRAGGRAVKVINVRVGQLRQVVPDTLVYCWELVSADTPLAGSRISIEAVPARIRCRSCDQVTDVGAVPVFACGGCGGFVRAIISAPGATFSYAIGAAGTDVNVMARPDSRATWLTCHSGKRPGKSSR